VNRSREADGTQQEPEGDDATGVLVFSLAEAESLVTMLQDLCGRMRDRGRPDEADVEIVVDMPSELRRASRARDG